MLQLPKYQDWGCDRTKKQKHKKKIKNIRWYPPFVRRCQHPTTNHPPYTYPITLSFILTIHRAWHSWYKWHNLTQLNKCGSVRNDGILTYTWDKLQTIEWESLAFCRTPATFIDSMHSSNHPGKTYYQHYLKS